MVSGTINSTVCNGCGTCISVCPVAILGIKDRKAYFIPGREQSCYVCSQCMAVCPNDAISGLLGDGQRDALVSVAPSGVGSEAFQHFLESRRSVRMFRNSPVERGVLEKIIAAMETAPMGLPPHKSNVVVITDPTELAHLAEVARKSNESLESDLGKAVPRTFMRLFMGKSEFETLRSHVLPLVRHIGQLFAEDGKDRYLYGAPVVMLFHVDTRAFCHLEDSIIAATYGMLAAHANGLGCTMMGNIPPVVEHSRELRARYGIPSGHSVTISLIMGYPKYQFRKGIRRTLAGVTFMDGNEVEVPSRGV